MKVRIGCWPGPEENGNIFGGAHAYYSLIDRSEFELFECSPKNILPLKPDIWHIHWPDISINTPNFFVATFKLFLLSTYLLIFRLQGRRIVWTVHNLRPHDAFFPKLANIYLTIFSNLCSDVVHLTNAGKIIAEKEYPALIHKNNIVIHHPLFIDPDNIPNKKKDGRIPNDKIVLGFLGAIRPYKNIEESVLKLLNRENSDELFIIIAGGINKSYEKKFKSFQEKMKGKNVLILPEKISDNEFINLSKNCHALVITNNDLFNSGNAYMGPNLNIPVIAPDTPIMNELRESIGHDCIHLFKSIDQISSILDDVLKLDQKCNPNLAQFTKEYLAPKMNSFYRNMYSRLR